MNSLQHMTIAADFQLPPRRVAQAVQVLQHWRLPELDDALALRAGALQALAATDALAALTVPADLQATAAGRVAGADGDGAILDALLGQAQQVLEGAPHLARIGRLGQRAPQVAADLEAARRAAVAAIADLRRRLAFVLDGLDALEEPVFIRQRAERTRVFQ